MTLYGDLIKKLKKEIDLKDAVQYIKKNSGCFYFLLDSNHLFKCALVILIHLFKKKITNETIHRAKEYIDIIKDKIKVDNIYTPIAYIYIIIFNEKTNNKNIECNYIKLLKDYILNYYKKNESDCFNFCASLFKKHKLYKSSQYMFRKAYEYYNEHMIDNKLKCIIEVAKISELLGEYDDACYYYDLHVNHSNEKYCMVNAFTCAILSNNNTIIQKYRSYFKNNNTISSEKIIIDLIYKSIKYNDINYLSEIFDEYGSTPALIDIKKKIKQNTKK